MDRGRGEQAAKLLAKAASTDSDAESMALIEHTYGLLAKGITEHVTEQGETSGPGGFERRLVPDRRRAASSYPISDRAAHAGALYSETAMITYRSEQHTRV